jgi:hypothetical protein
MSDLVCLVPGVGVLYEVLTFAREDGDLIVEAFQGVGPVQSAPGYREWKANVEATMAPAGRVIQYITPLPRTMQPVNPNFRRVYRDRSAFDTQSLPTRDNPLVPSLRKAIDKYGGLTYKDERAGGGGMMVFGGRYFGGYYFVPGSVAPIRYQPDQIDHYSVPGWAATEWRKELRKQLEPFLGPYTKSGPRPTEWGTIQVAPYLDRPYLDRFGDHLDYWILGTILAVPNYGEVSQAEKARYLQRVVDLREKRGVSFKDFIAPVKNDFRRFFLDPKERRSYGRKFVQTFSADKALKAVFPNIKGSAKSIRAELPDLIPASEAKRIYNFGPSLADMAKRGLSAEAALELASIGHAGSHPEALPRLKASEIRDLIRNKRYQARDIDELIDAARILVQNENDLLEVPPENPTRIFGQRMLGAFRRRDWHRIRRAHDQIVAMDRAVTEIVAQTIIDREDAGKRRKRKSQLDWFVQNFEFLPGAYPLVSGEDFNLEADLMNHCIWSYRNDVNLFHFHIKHPETGEDSTVQLNKFGDVRQHYGPMNDQVSPTQQAYLDRMLQMNEPIWETAEAAKVLGIINRKSREALRGGGR